jgi:predicted nucleic acid-binding protein
MARENKISLVISEWVVNECIWAVQKKILDNKISKHDAFIIINHIADIIEEGLEQGFLTSYAINEQIVIGSRLIIQEINLNASDSLHIFIAGVSECEYLVTADKEFIYRVKQHLPGLIPVDVNDSVLMNKFFMIDKI